MKVVIAGGGTGGHLFPGLALARELSRRGARILFIGGSLGPEAALVPASGFEIETIDIMGRARGISFDNVKAAYKLVAATAGCLRIIGKFDPDVIVGTGGYVSLPAMVAGWIHRIPLVVHEQNAKLGLANAVASKLADTVAVSYERTEGLPGAKGTLTGNPVREEIAHLDRNALKGEAYAHFDLDPERRTLLIVGGSQGARSLNESVLASYPEFRDDGRLQVLLIAGPQRLEEVDTALKTLRNVGDRVGMRTLGFNDRMELAYAIADLAVCRAGATTLAELVCAGVPAILVPLPFSLDDDQRRNAEHLVSSGAAELIEDSDLAIRLSPVMTALIHDVTRLQSMADAMTGLARPNAAGDLADVVLATGRAKPAVTVSVRVTDVTNGSSIESASGVISTAHRVHLIGAGGSGMSAIARVLAEGGHAVSGSDIADSETLSSLRYIGVDSRPGHHLDLVENADLVICSAAIPPNDPELERARALGIPMLSRAEALGQLVNNLDLIAVGGSAGKSSTSGMVCCILDGAHLDPTFLIGGELISLGVNARRGAGRVAVAEADEAFGSFLSLLPAIALLTNVDYDHHDFYDSEKALEDAFQRFLENSKQVVVCADDKLAVEVAKRARESFHTYGLGDTADFRASSIEAGSLGSEFDLITAGWGSSRVRISARGMHSVQNAAGAAAACLLAGVSIDDVVAGLESFKGVKRRFEFRGEVNGAKVYDDYAHHPRKIGAVLDAARVSKPERVVAVFQPHLFSRTKMLANDFGKALSVADVVIVTEVYGAREEPSSGVTAKLVVDAVAESAPGKRLLYLRTLDEAARWLKEEMRDGDLVLTMGAGDVTRLPDLLLSQNK